MDDSITMNVLKSWYKLFHKFDCFFLLQSFVIDDIVKKFSSLCVLHDQVNFRSGLDDLYANKSTS